MNSFRKDSSGFLGQASPQYCADEFGGAALVMVRKSCQAMYRSGISKSRIVNASV